MQYGQCGKIYLLFSGSSLLTSRGTCPLFCHYFMQTRNQLHMLLQHTDHMITMSIPCPIIHSTAELTQRSLINAEIYQWHWNVLDVIHRVSFRRGFSIVRVCKKALYYALDWNHDQSAWYLHISHIGTFLVLQWTQLTKNSYAARAAASAVSGILNRGS
jgi:hypothetical protein